MHSARRMLLFMCLSLLLVPAVLPAQQAPRQLSEADMAKLRRNVDASRTNAAEAQCQAALARQQEELRRQEEALANAEAEDYWEDEMPQQSSGVGFAGILETFTTTFNEEMAKKQQADEQQRRFLDNVRREAEAVARQRQRDLERERLAQERLRLEHLAQQQRQQAARVQTTIATPATSAASPQRSATPAPPPSSPAQAAADRDEALRASVAAERQRQQQLREQQAASAEKQRAASEKIAAERRQAEEQQHQAARQARARHEQNLLGSFRGAAITCPGGGKDVLYLRSSSPPKTGCNVAFEARCPGTANGNGVHFSQANYIGASCGMGDNIRIGPMSCAAEQVSIRMTQADCG